MSAGTIPITVAQPWPRDASDRVNDLIGQLAAKEQERWRLVECLRLIVTTEKAVNLSKQRRDLPHGAQQRLVNAAVAEKNKAIERAQILLRDLHL